MKIAFQADADLDPDVIRGVRRREPFIDFSPAAGVIPDATPDAEVLRIVAEMGRVLVSRDLRTMRAHFEFFTAMHDSPGVILVPSTRSISEIIDGLLVVWLTWTPEEMRNQIRWLP